MPLGYYGTDATPATLSEYEGSTVDGRTSG